MHSRKLIDEQLTSIEKAKNERQTENEEWEMKIVKSLEQIEKMVQQYNGYCAELNLLGGKRTIDGKDTREITADITASLKTPLSSAMKTRSAIEQPVTEPAA